MSAPKPVTIIGGGLAGLTLGIGLRQRGVPVTLWEAGGYPRHRVCGEFVSGRGRAVLERLGLLERFRAAGAIEVRTALFVCGPVRSPVRPLADAALGCSRHVMDALLAEEFQERGGELRVHSRWLPGDDREGLVHASGRVLVHPAPLPRWFGVKAHVPANQPLSLDADLEMYLLRDGYVGISRIGGGVVNVCGLFCVREGGRRPESKTDWLRGEPGDALHQRLAGVEFDPGSVCSVAGLQLAPRRAANRTECRIGDALTLTPPATGNGMSMAFESAEIALDPLTAYSEGKMAWGAAQQRIARRCDGAFARRLRWARWLQWLMSSPPAQGGLAPLCLRSDWFWRWMFARTR